MNLELKLALKNAMDEVLDNHAEKNLWENYIHSELTMQMTNAAESVFDAAQLAQSFLIKETE